MTMVCFCTAMKLPSSIHKHLDINSAVERLTTCNSLSEGRLLHESLMKQGLTNNELIGNHLVQMYSRCGSLQDARTILSNLQHKDITTWNTILSTTAKSSQFSQTFNLYTQMRTETQVPNKYTFISVLSALKGASDLKNGEIVHLDIQKSGFHQDPYVGTAILNMYGKCGDLDAAISSFSQIPIKDLVSWNAMIMACAENDDCKRGFMLIRAMWQEGLIPNRSSFVAILSCCRDCSYLGLGRQLHARILDIGLISDVIVATALLTMYARCGCIVSSLSVFERMPERNIVSWNALTAGYAQYGHYTEALTVYRKMQLEGFTPNRATFVTILKSFSNTGLVPEIQEIHERIIHTGLGSDLHVGTALVTMFGICGQVEFARRVFVNIPEKNVVAWNAMMTALAENGCSSEALELFLEMEEDKRVEPNKITYICALVSCKDEAGLALGRTIHSKLTHCDTSLLNALAGMYSRCGSLQETLDVLELITYKDNVTWNTKVAAFSQHGQPENSLATFYGMQLEGFKPDKVTLTSVFDVCADLGFVDLGEGLCDCLAGSGQTVDFVVESAMMNMYGKCGRIDKCEALFKGMQKKDVVAWNTMISVYGQHGCGNLALNTFWRMQQEGTSRPDSSTFVNVLYACSHSGLVEDGCFAFNLMRDFKVKPVEHYACMVDVLGRMGYLREAEEFIQRIPSSAKKDPFIWASLLGACSNYGNLECGERAANKFMEISQENPVGYVVLANIYAAAERWEDASKIRELMLKRGVKKQIPGKSSIIIKNKVHTFFVRDRRHPRSDDIYAELHRLRGVLDKLGYVSDTSLVLHDVEEEQKQELLWYHSEKLAIAYGLLTVHGNIPLRIIKNLRVCRDCHAVTKLISRVANKEIVVRDNTRFHHFKDGKCSCADYW